MAVIEAPVGSEVAVGVSEQQYFMVTHEFGPWVVHAANSDKATTAVEAQIPGIDEIYGFTQIQGVLPLAWLLNGKETETHLEQHDGSPPRTASRLGGDLKEEPAARTNPNSGRSYWTLPGHDLRKRGYHEPRFFRYLKRGNDGPETYSLYPELVVPES
jgi:hypothetical protein